MQAIGIDLGGTRIKGVLINRNGKILEELVKDTLLSNEIWKQDVQKVYETLAGSATEQYVVGLSAPGIPIK